MGKEVDLLQAVKSGDIVTVQKILCKTSTNSKKTNGSVVKQSSLNQQDADGLSVLHHAALVGNSTLIKLLLDNGIKVDVKDNKGLRPLHYAAWLGKEKPVELLLHYGSLVNESALDGATPLHMACEHGHTEVVEKLLTHKGDPSLKNNQHRTPFDLACEFGRTQVIETLLTCEMSLRLRSESDSDILDNSKTTCLHLAARNGHVDVINLLIEFGFNINQQTPQGTCLHEASKYGKTEVVRLLLANGIDVSRLNSYEETALEIVNKFTATRAAKELKQILKEASSELLAQAVRDYSKPLDASHLAFREGDIIMVVDHFSKNGLWKGYSASAGGHVTHIGYFPSEAVVIIDPNSTNRDSGFSANNSCIGLSFNPPESTDGQQNRLSGQSLESGVSGVSSYQPSSRSPVSYSHGSLENLDDNSFSSSLFKAHETPVSTDLSDLDILNTWLRNLQLDDYIHLFVNAGYDLQTISRMTPEDLTAIGVTQPSVRKKLKSEISRLAIPNGIPNFRPSSVKEWLAILHLSEYYDLLIQQGYSDFDSVVGIMWEDLEEIGIQKLGHQKKIMLAIDKLKKVTGASHPTVSSGEFLSSHLTNDLPPMSFASHQLCTENLNSALGRTCSPSHSRPRCVNMNLSREMVNPLPSSAANASFSTGFSHLTPGINHFNLILPSCQACSSFRTRTCDNSHSNDVIGPAPPLPLRGAIDSDSMLTKRQIFSSRKVENVNNLSHLHHDWCPGANLSKITTKIHETPCDFDICGKGHKFTTYGTLPRRPMHRGQGVGHFYGNDVDALTSAIEKPTNKPFLTPKCLNSAKISPHSFKITGDKQPVYLDSSIPRFYIASDKHRLDAFNLEGEFQIYPQRIYAHPVLSSCSVNPDRSFLSTSTNETMMTNYSKQCSAIGHQSDNIFGKETASNCEIIRDNVEKCEQTSPFSNDFSLVSCQNLSSVSLNSSDSSGTFDGSTLPFANEDYGTIKERITVPPSSSNMMTKASNDLGGDDKVDGSRNTAAKENHVLNNNEDRILSDTASASHQSFVSSQADEAVFNDIDGMLLGLTQELDEMLKFRV